MKKELYDVAEKLIKDISRTKCDTFWFPVITPDCDNNDCNNCYNCDDCTEPPLSWNDDNIVTNIYDVWSVGISELSRFFRQKCKQDYSFESIMESRNDDIISKALFKMAFFLESRGWQIFVKDGQRLFPSVQSLERCISCGAFTTLAHSDKYDFDYPMYRCTACNGETNDVVLPKKSRKLMKMILKTGMKALLK